MKTLVDKILKCEKNLRPEKYTLSWEDKSTLANYVFTHTDFYFWGNFGSNAGSQPGNLPIKVRLNIDYPIDAQVNPTWDALVVDYNDFDYYKSDAFIVTRLAKVNRLTGMMTVIAEFGSNKNRANGCQEGIAMFNIGFDFYENLYFIELELIKTPIEDVSKITYKIGLVNNST